MPLKHFQYVQILFVWDAMLSVIWGIRCAYVCLLQQT